ncbi:MAG: cytidylate kinase [Chloroflexi bacterium RBG_13_50_21]|nr:MAG: cytidylate kinase [Chloroflexi bacterium RBG_13_50_21]OGO65934.1 MAG: cytidylate kinase [Chloroflexi bacterium RBG_19FT_COMBO_50_10]
MQIAKIIAIDGPAASGKSTLGHKLAQVLGYLYFDSGVMYRAVTWLAIQQGVDIRDETAITKLAEITNIIVRSPSIQDGRAYDVIVDSQDITWDIRRPEVDGNVSPVSTYAGVRKSLSAQQRRIGLGGNVVMVGRDIGTVVLPEADLKIYLDASAEERARRRYKELCQRGKQADYDAILQVILERDQIDSNRKVAPLRPANDAHILCSDGLDADQVLELAKALVFGK